MRRHAVHYLSLMKSLPRLTLACASFALACLVTNAWSAESFTPSLATKKKVLFFSKSSGFEHDAIKLQLKDGKPGFAFAVVRDLGEKNNIEFTFSKDGSLFNPEYLAQFDAYFFYTSGDLTMAKSDPRGDGLPPMTPAGKAALLKAVADGKGFVATHSASDCFHSFGRNGHVPQRFDDDGDKADDYIKMLGGEFIRHGAQQKSRVIVADRKFPGVAAIPADWDLLEEWYSLKNFAANLHVVLVQDTTGMVGAEYQRANYPTTWARMHEKGRVFYTSFGHREDVWTNPAFQSLLAGALNWALRRVDADVTPNLAAVTPKAGVLPRYIPPQQTQAAGKKTNDKKE